MTRAVRLPLAFLVAVLLATPAAARQTPPPAKPQPPAPTTKKPAPTKPRPPRQYRAFIALGGGIQAPAGGWSDQLSFEAHAETGSADIDYASKAAPTLDVGFGYRFWKKTGIAVGLTRSAVSSSVHVEADMPHPFFDDADRHVAGDAGDIGREETAVHLQLFWVREHRKWRTRVLGGFTYFNVKQDLVTEVDVVETYPYDTAEFSGVTTERASGSGPGFNVGVDIAWMMTREFGFGGAVRYTRGRVDLNGSGSSNVSTDAGGAQAVAGVRIAF